MIGVISYFCILFRSHQSETDINCMWSVMWVSCVSLKIEYICIVHYRLFEQFLSLFVIYTVSQKKNVTLFICDNLVRCHPILLVFGRNPSKLETSTYTQHITSHFYVFILYLVKMSNDFCGTQYSIKYTRHRTSLPQACGHRIVPTWLSSWL